MTPMTLNKLTHRDFERAMHKAFWRDLVSRLTRKSNDLLPFDQVCRSLPLKGQYSLGLQAIPLDKIVGSMRRYQDFDRAFFPRQNYTQERWIRIDKAYYQQVQLPPVDLLKIGEFYFVRDGNHRVSVARARKQEFIDAYVTVLELSVPVEPQPPSRPQ